ncbi:MAG: adenylosuccinate synthase [Acidobacteria bacterium]|nr:MAG: adenylosuccinate synthase [Acidobacteriota bacterium]
MPCVVVVGGQWGDEGKGKIVDRLTQRAQVVVRYQGGPNAGHTVVVDGKRFALRHLPSGILRPEVLSVVANGVVIDPASLLQEIREIRQAGVRVESNLRVSDRAHLILPEHRTLDAESEDALADAKIGTTRRGIGPAYESKVARLGLRVGDLRSPQSLREKLGAYRTARFKRLSQQPAPNEGEAVLKEYLGYAEALEPFIDDTLELLHRRLEQGETLLFEGAQGTLLDLDHGTYPFVTSSNSTAGGACTGSGIGPTRITGVLGVFKAYCSRVGAGPFPTEQQGEAGDRIRERGREYGTVTGRPRRCGWFDGVLGRYAVRVNSMDSAALTLLDVLDEFEQIPVAVAYQLQGENIHTLPADQAAFSRCQPVYEVLPGWRRPTRDVKRFEELPAGCRDYVDRLERMLGCEIAMVSVGPDRKQTLQRSGSRLEGWLASRD